MMLEKEITVSVNWVKSLVMYAEQAGCDKARLLKQCRPNAGCAQQDAALHYG